MSPRLALAAAFVLIISLGAAWFGFVAERSKNVVAVQSASPQQVQQILDRIETRLELDEFLLSPSYATDILLTQNSVEPDL